MIKDFWRCDWFDSLPFPQSFSFSIHIELHVLLSCKTCIFSQQLSANPRMVCHLFDFDFSADFPHRHNRRFATDISFQFEPQPQARTLPFPACVGRSSRPGLQAQRGTQTVCLNPTGGTSGP